MKKALLLIGSVGMLALAGCGADDGVSPMAPTVETTETEFPVSKEFPGLETEIAARHDPEDDLVDTAIDAGRTRNWWSSAPSADRGGVP